MNEFLIVFIASYFWHSLGVTVGYHRLLSHRSFACLRWVEYFFVAGGYLAFEGSPIWWATIHRAHHRYVDTPLDPHSPRFGLHNAHFGWLMHDTYASHINPTTQSKDLMSDPVYKFLEQGGDWRRAHRLVFTISFVFRLIILLCFGWVPALASLLAGFAVLQIPLMLNVACHIPRLGYKNYAMQDDSVNVWWVALLAMGEGWHNNHHASPGSARTGLRPWELDVSWLVIGLMKRLGLVSRVNATSHEQLLAKSANANAPQVAPAALPVPAVFALSIAPPLPSLPSLAKLQSLPQLPSLPRLPSLSQLQSQSGLPTLAPRRGFQSLAVLPITQLPGAREPLTRLVMTRAKSARLLIR